MVARPGAISLPLVAGQNQKVDERILPPGEFARVYDARQTRDGRQLARDGFAEYPVYLVAGQTSSNLKPVRCVGDGDLFVADSGDLPYWTQVYRAGVRSRARIDTADAGYASVKLTALNEGGISSLIPERVIPVSSYRGDREQVSATADFSERGEWLVSAHCDSGAVVVVWRSRDSLEVVASWREEPVGYGSPTSNTNYVQCSVVCAKQTRETAVVAVKLNGAIDILYFANAGDEATVTSSGVVAMMNTNDNSTVDTVTIDGSLNFVFVYSTVLGGSYVRCVGFTAPHAFQWETNVFSPGQQYTMSSIDAHVSGTLLWSVAATDPSGVTRSLRCGTLNFGTGAAVATSALLTLGAGDIPGVPFATHISNLGTGATAHLIALTRLNASYPTGTVYAWDGVNASTIGAMASRSNAVVAGRVFLNASDDAYYPDSAFRRLLVPMMQSGRSNFDSDLAYDATRPVFLMNIGGDIAYNGEGGWGVTYSPGTPSEAGLLAINGEVGQATHPLVSPVYPGEKGWTLGAPSKVVRITSTVGEPDTDLTGTYVLTFDVSAPGRSRAFGALSWRQALVNLPRQGRLALFKPMKAQHCELEPVRANETLVPGLTPSVCDGVSTHSCGFLEAPIIDTIVGVVSTVHPPGAGTYSVTAVFEWTDSQGRRYQSAPAIPRDVTLGATEQATITFRMPVACYTGVALAVYRTRASGSEFKRDGALTLGSTAALDTFFQLTEDQLSQQETLYTSLGEVPNDPPPSAQRFARTRDRVWAYGLDRPEVIQSSKLLADGRGICWSNAANFFVVLPEEVVAVETLDETAVVFTEKAIYTIGGSGPGDDGIGAFVEPGRIPGYVGCISPRSVISVDAGIFFLSQRGIELLPRGFGAAQWIGQPVMQDVADFPECRGVTADPENDLIVWSMVNPVSWEERLLTFDVRTQSWATYVVEPTIDAGTDEWNVPSVGLSVGGENPVRTVEKKKRLVLWTDTSDRVRIQSPGDCRDYYYDDAGVPDFAVVTPSWTTGWVRLGGVSGWQIVRRMTVVVTPLLDDWTLDCDVSYNDDPAVVGTVQWDAIGDVDGRSLTLELALPVVQFESIKISLRVGGNNDSGPALQVHSVMLHSEQDGARLPRANRR